MLDLCGLELDVAAGGHGGEVAGWPGPAPGREQFGEQTRRLSSIPTPAHPVLNARMIFPLSGFSMRVAAALLRD